MKKFIFITITTVFSICIGLLCSCSKSQSYSVTYLVENGGGGVIYGDTFQESDAYGFGSKVTAVANEGYRFAGWSDGVEAAERSDKELTESKTVTAKFEKIEYCELKYIAMSGGAVYGETFQRIEKSTDGTTVIAVANEGYRFAGWSDGVETAERSDKELTESKTVTAKFEKIEYCELKYIATSGGAVYGETFQRIEKSADGTTVIAVANDGYRFAGWSDGVETAERSDKELTESKTVTAKFEKIEYCELKYIATSGGAVYGETFQRIEKSTDGTTVIAVANEGYRFAGWSDGVETAERSNKEVNGSKTVTATFEKIPVYLVNYNVDGDGGKIGGTFIQNVLQGENCSAVYAQSNNGYRFVKWSDGLTDIYRTDENIQQNLEVKAEFEQIFINFYSDNYLVRKMPLSSLNSAETSKLIGYKSNSEFLKWKYSGSLADIAAGYEGDALELIKQQYNLYGISNSEDLNIEAVYAPHDLGSVPTNSKTIAHGLGGLENTSYINSKESFEHYYKLGQRFFEADFELTTDKIPIVSHFNFNVSYNEFMSTAKEGYTPMDLKSFLEIVSQYPDIIVDLDVLGVYYGPYESIDANYEAFFREFDTMLKEVDETGALYNRFILEILPNAKTNMFNIARKYCQFSNFLYAEYYDSTSAISDDNIVNICKWCSDNGVRFLSIETIEKEWVDVMHSYGIYVMTFAYNDPITMYKFYDMGVDCIFTDFTFI